jgi:hypothetical protein
MAASGEPSQPSLAIPDHMDTTGDEAENLNDPFLSSSGGNKNHRYSHFDNQLFSLGPAASPEQAKRALEAHLAETEKRIQDASKLGTTLVNQRKELAERLKEVEKQQSEGDITPELRQKLVEIEKEYNEVGRESARAFLPKSRVSSSEMAAGSPFAGEGKVCLMSVVLISAWLIKLVAIRQSIQIRKSSHQLAVQIECAKSQAKKPTSKSSP